jgi:hypothetical protein
MPSSVAHPAPKRARQSRPGAAADIQATPAQAQADEDADENFSDGETTLQSTDAAADWELPGFDLSGCPSADSTQLKCDLCAEVFELSWHAGRQELVVHGAVVLLHRMYHQRCADERLVLLQLPLRRAEAAT